MKLAYGDVTLMNIVKFATTLACEKAFLRPAQAIRRQLKPNFTVYCLHSKERVGYDLNIRGLILEAVQSVARYSGYLSGPSLTQYHCSCDINKIPG